MQEELESRTLTLVISTAKMSGQTLKQAIEKYMAHHAVPHGKQSVKQLIRQGHGVSNVQIQDTSAAAFERIARKYGVDFAVKKDRTFSPPRYLVFFKARDIGAIQSALREYTVRKTVAKPSVLQRLTKFQTLVKNAAAKVKKKVLSR